MATSVGGIDFSSQDSSGCTCAVIGVREMASETVRSDRYMDEITYMNKVNIFF